MKTFLDTESGAILTETELKKEFFTLRDFGETDCKTFNQYLFAITCKNGTMEEIKNK